MKTRKSRLEFIYQFEVNKGTKEVFGNFFFKATKSENSNMPVGSRLIIQMFCNLNRFLLASKWTALTGQFLQSLRLF